MESLARDRGVAMVFQDYALYPHLTVAENIAFPLRFLEEPDRAARVGEVMRLLALDTVPHRRPDQLSGGQRQRLAMARAIARPPRAFLLDQPMSSLDAAAREEVRATVLDLVHSLGVATVYVTHDQVEALCMADRVAVMRSGRIEQIGPPEQVYSDPQRLFVAAFVGSPRMNLIQAAVYAETDVRTVIDLGTQTIAMPWEDPRAAALARYHTSRITVGIRPDALTLTTNGAARLARVGAHGGAARARGARAPGDRVRTDPAPALAPGLPDVPGSLAQVAGEPLPTPPGAPAAGPAGAADMLRPAPARRAGRGTRSSRPTTRTRTSPGRLSATCRSGSRPRWLPRVGDTGLGGGRPRPAVPLRWCGRTDPTPARGTWGGAIVDMPAA